MNNYVSMPHAALCVVQHSISSLMLVKLTSFNAARGFVCGAAAKGLYETYMALCFNAARGFVCGAAIIKTIISMLVKVSMPHAALCVVQHVSENTGYKCLTSFNAARGFVCGAASSLAALVPLR